jgi:hypothetical protein
MDASGPGLCVVAAYYPKAERVCAGVRASGSASVMAHKRKAAALLGPPQGEPISFGRDQFSAAVSGSRFGRARPP